MPVYGQTRVIMQCRDQIRMASGDREKVRLIMELSDLSISPDSLLPYVVEAERIAGRSGDPDLLNRAAYTRIAYYARKNISDSGLQICERLLSGKIDTKKDPRFYLQVLFFKAKLLDRSNQYTRALEQLMEVIRVAQESKDTLILIQARNGIGWVQMEMEQYNEALQWFYLSLHTSADTTFYKNYGALYSNIANAWSALGRADSAQYYIRIAIDDARRNENLSFLATALSMQGKILVNAGKSLEAEAPLREALNIRKQLRDPYYIVYDISNLASFYAGNGQAEKGIALCLEGIDLAGKTGMSSQLLLAYQALAANYKAAGRPVEYAKSLERIQSLKDSFNTINTSKLLTEMKAAEEARKSEITIAGQRISLLKRKYWLAGSLLFTLMFGAIVWLLFRNYRRRQRLKLLDTIAREKLQRELAIREAEEKERNRIAADLHDNLGAYASSLVANLASLSLRDNDPVAYRAKEELQANAQAIISELNDTIWVMKKDQLALTAISDRLKNFIRRIANSFPSVVIDVREQIDRDPVLTSSQAFHLYRVLQEALHNALKHSRASKINISFSGGVGWSVEVEDNGTGMPATENYLAGSGNGLQHMRERCREAGWNISWSSPPAGGTRVTISPTTN